MYDLVKESVKALKPYTISKEIAAIKLDANENPSNLLDDFKDEFINRLTDLNINRYPDIDSENLTEKIAEYAGVKKENIICGNGSDEIIQIIINTFVDKGDFVVTHSPTFSMYGLLTGISGGKVVEVPSDDEFNIDIDGIIRASNEKRAKVIFLCNPNNPTGTVTKKENILKIIDNTNSIVVVDEAYYEFLGETVIDSINKCSRLIVLRTLSKAFGLAGARVGYAAASSDMIGILLRSKPPYNINSISQILGVIFLENMDRVRERVDDIKIERDYITGELEKINEIKVFKTGSNFVLIKSDKSGSILKACSDEKIALRGFSDPDFSKYIRITVGSRKENNRVINMIKRVVQT